MGKISSLKCCQALTQLPRAVLVSPSVERFNISVDVALGDLESMVALAVLGNG